MKIKVDKSNINADWCSQIVFKGAAEVGQLLCKELEKSEIVFTKEENKNNWIISFGGVEVKKVISLVKNFNKLKVSAFLDEFDSSKARNTYVVYSEKEEEKFTKIIFVGTCDGQTDLPFSEEANLLQTKEKKYPVVMYLTGKKSSISYSFPFVFEWEDEDTDKFEFYGKTIIKYKGTNDKVKIPDGVDRIGRGAFENNSTVKSVHITKNVKIIEEKAFYRCTSLADIVIDKGLEFLGSSAFEGCESLTEVTLPDSLSKIKITEGYFNSFSSKVFSGCKKLKKVVLSEKLKTIPEAFFENCEALDTINFSKGIVTIEAKAFSGCRSLKQIILPYGLKKISGSHGFGQSFSECEALKDIFIPHTVEKIAGNTFEGCKDLVIHTTADGYVSKFAREHNIDCVIEKRNV